MNTIFEHPEVDRSLWIIYLVIGFIAVFFATETNILWIKILCAFPGIALIVFGLIDLFKKGDKK